MEAIECTPREFGDCPICGECTCLWAHCVGNAQFGDPGRPDCPLHGINSRHGTVVYPPLEAVSTVWGEMVVGGES
jgi:hypothetical protein